MVLPHILYGQELSAHNCGPHRMMCKLTGERATASSTSYMLPNLISFLFATSLNPVRTFFDIQTKNIRLAPRFKHSHWRSCTALLWLHSKLMRAAQQLVVGPQLCRIPRQMISHLVSAPHGELSTCDYGDVVSFASSFIMENGWVLAVVLGFFDAKFVDGGARTFHV